VRVDVWVEQGRIENSAIELCVHASYSLGFIFNKIENSARMRCSDSY
jgi:hypothetical protein